MLATQCSFCQHENTPGTRFCAECGSPMHLKVCPNPACGKVSDVATAVCESCGQPFPKMTLVSPETVAVAETTGTTGSAPSGEAPAEKDKARMPAWPLVMVAVVAGGLPLLWANRAQLPTPKTWQVTPSPSDVPKPSATAPAPVALTPPPRTESAPPPSQTPTSAAPSAPPSLAPTPALAATPNADDQDKPNADTADDITKGQARQPATSAGSKKIAKTPPAKKAEAPRPCTEAVAALGLCDPKQAAK